MDFLELDGIKIVSSSKMEVRDYFRKLLLSRVQDLIVTFNLDFFRISSENERFYSLCKEADLVVPDGIGIVKLIKAKYGIQINRITGNDLFGIVLGLSSELPIRVALIGSSPDVLSKVKKKISREYPDVNIAEAISPPNLFEKNESINSEIVDKLKAAQPNVLFTALGCPRQEFWLKEHMNEIGANINIGVGAVFDFYSGNKKRSPDLFQNLSLEWFWRLLNEPRRLTKRYIFKDLPFYLKKRIRYGHVKK